MHPFFFGDPARQLFGVYEAAQAGRPRPLGVLLCNPYGQEAIRVHRIFRVLSDQLMRVGCHVMRFDYYGTGDSAGDCLEASLAQCQSDVLSADQELRDMAGVQRTLWIGLRLGATLAALAARKAPAGLGGVVLWDPVVNGRQYLAEMSRAHWEYLGEELDDMPQAVARSRNVSEGAMREALGFERSPALQQELEQLDLLGLDRKPSRKVAILAGSAPPTPRELEALLLRLGSEVVWLDSLGEESWNSDDAMNAFAVPRATLASIVDLVGGWR